MVELFEKIRRDHEFAGLSVRELASRCVVHRRTVRQALASAVPPESKRPVGRPAPALGPWREWIDGILVADRKAPVKQRHKAKRIADRLADELLVVIEHAEPWIAQRTPLPPLGHLSPFQSLINAPAIARQPPRRTACYSPNGRSDQRRLGPPRALSAPFSICGLLGSARIDSRFFRKQLSVIRIVPSLMSHLSRGETYD
jgi:hypothetical protein